jgi:uncharacterized protein (TIRG00374 family)
LNTSFKNKGKNSLNVLRWLPGLVISAIAIFALIRFIRIGDSISILVNTNPWLLLLMALFTILFLIVRAFGWKSLLGEKATYSETFLKLGEGYFINNIFPLRLGEISRALFMGASMKVNPGQVLSTIVIERVFDLLILAVSLLIMLPYALGMGWVKTIAWGILSAMLVGLLVLYFISRNQQRVNLFLIKVGNRFSFFKKNIMPFVTSVIVGFQALKRPSQLFFGLLGILGSWFVSFIQYSLILFLMAGPIKLWWGAFANTIMAMGIALPSAPAGLGIFETSIVAALNLFGINEALALAYAIFLHATQFVITALIGLYALFKDGRSVKGLFSNLLTQQNIGTEEYFSGVENG